ncbi:MAG: stage II sporulation protein M [Chloroflexota bacterium]
MKYRWWIGITALLYAGGLLLGLVTPASVASFPAQDVENLKKLADFLSPLPRPAVFVFILVKNMTVVLISFAFSPIFCLAPIVTLILNGWLLGFVATSVIQERSIGYLLVGIVPHGIFEIPALIIGEAVALNFGISIMLAIFKKGAWPPDLKRNLKYLVISLILFLPAAFIETYITPLFLR